MNEESYRRIKELLTGRVRAGIDMGREVSDEEVTELIADVMLESEEVSSEAAGLKRQMGREIFNSLRRLDILQSYIEDPSVSEIMINGPDSIFVERGGRLEKLDRGFDSEEKLLDVVQQIVSGCNRVVNESSPIVDARLRDGSRVNVVMKPIALNGPIVTIRRFPEDPITMDRLLEMESISEEAARFLETLVKAGYNIIISGGTGSGKTTMLGVLAGFIPPDERIITIEDSAELQIRGIENLVRLETRNSSTSGTGEVTIRDLIRSSLRMRPDRIIVGEVRGGEALDMLQAMNTGHDGSLGTLHSNGTRDAISRLENMVLMGAELPLAAIRQQIASGLDIIVQLSRLRDRSRRVVEISEVLGFENGEVRLGSLYRFEERGFGDGRVVGALERTGELAGREKLRLAGLSEGEA